MTLFERLTESSSIESSVPQSSNPNVWKSKVYGWLKKSFFSKIIDWKISIGNYRFVKLISFIQRHIACSKFDIIHFTVFNGTFTHALNEITTINAACIQTYRLIYRSVHIWDTNYLDLVGTFFDLVQFPNTLDTRICLCHGCSNESNHHCCHHYNQLLPWLLLKL